METSSAEQIKKVKDLIEDINVSIFTTRHDGNKLRGRPMGTVKVEDDGSIWFFTNEYSGKVDEISHNNEVYLTYASQGSSKYIVVQGTAELSDDKAKIKELWSPAMKVWFPKGLDDPKILLIKVNPSEAEYWEGAENKFMVYYGMAKAFITGEKYNEGKHDKVDM